MKGYRWWVGNGLSIEASTDPWIPKEGLCKPLMTHPSIHHFTVAQLLDNQEMWGESLILGSFLEDEANKIINIPIRSELCKDEVIWPSRPKRILLR